MSTYPQDTAPRRRKHYSELLLIFGCLVLMTAMIHGGVVADKPGCLDLIGMLVGAGIAVIGDRGDVAAYAWVGLALILIPIAGVALVGIVLAL